MNPSSPQWKEMADESMVRNLAAQIEAIWPQEEPIFRRHALRDRAQILDVGCGTGWSTIAMAQAYPRISVDGFDLDQAAIEAARDHAERAGVADRVRFVVADASDPGMAGRYDLVTIFEALHDLARPVEALRAARTMLRDGGVVLVADERVEDEFTAPGPERERYVYGWSVVACLPGAMDDPLTAATGAVLRRATLSRYATAAGFSAVEVLPIHSDDWRFYRLRP
jgi:2-polyprenyl-3-methyl-5-hydroxy-6-metoxy-1,4-benzoquinol methylase